MGRKTMQLQGAGLRVFLGMVEEFCKAHENDEGLREFVEPLRAGPGEWQALTLAIGKRAVAAADEIGAAAYDYLFYSGYMALAYWWVRSGSPPPTSSEPQPFKDATRQTSRIYPTRLLPRTLPPHAPNITTAA